jgi:hypothetical protein
VTKEEVQAFLRKPLDQTNPGLTGWPTAKFAMANHCAQAVTHMALGLLARVGL